MTPANGEYIARYVKDDGSRGPDLPVVAWNEYGEAMVLYDKELTVAEKVYGLTLTSVSRSRPVPKVVGAVPGGGWMVSSRFKGDSAPAEPIVEPVLSWVVYEDGDVFPVVATPDGSTSIHELDDYETKTVTVYHPDYPRP